MAALTEPSRMFELRPYEEGIKTLLRQTRGQGRWFELRPYEEGIKTGWVMTVL